MSWKFPFSKTFINAKRSKENKKKMNCEKAVNDILSRGEAAIKELPVRDTISENLIALRQLFKDCYDFTDREFTINNGKTKCSVAYLAGTVNNEQITETVIKPLLIWHSEHNEKEGSHEISRKIKNSIINNTRVEEVQNLEGILNSFLNGYCLLLIDGEETGLVIDVSGWEMRKSAESNIEPVLRGPAEAFVESVTINTALLRRRIKTPNFKLEKFNLGRISKTTVIMAYINGIAESGCINELRSRLQKIDIDMVIESADVEQLIYDAPLSPFPQINMTERPDTSVMALAQGKIVILVDGTPFVLIAPAVFSDFLLTPEDNYVQTYFAPFIILLRYVAFIISLLGPSAYVAITTFHQEMIPNLLLNTVTATRSNLPFPAFVEAIFMELTFEILREASERLPRAIGQSLGIVGTLLIGQAAIQSGLVSPAMVVVLAITAISSFVNPKLSMSRAIRVLKYPMMLLAAFLGIYGIIMGVLVLTIHAISLRSLGVPYLSPFGPLKLSDWLGSVIKIPLWASGMRPSFIQKNNLSKERAGSKPKPPAVKDEG